MATGTVEPFITTQEAAAFLGKPVSWLHGNAERLGMPLYKIGRQWRWRESELLDWARGYRVDGP